MKPDTATITSYKDALTLKFDKGVVEKYQLDELHDRIFCLHNYDKFRLDPITSPVQATILQEFDPVYPPAGSSQLSLDSLYQRRLKFARKMVQHPTALELFKNQDFQIYYLSWEDQ